jgi:hypothetical protein
MRVVRNKKAPVKAALRSPAALLAFALSKWFHGSALWTSVTGFRYLTINFDDKDQILDMLDQAHNKEKFFNNIRTLSAKRLFSLVNSIHLRSS